MFEAFPIVYVQGHHFGTGGSNNCPQVELIDKAVTGAAGLVWIPIVFGVVASVFAVGPSGLPPLHHRLIARPVHIHLRKTIPRRSQWPQLGENEPRTAFGVCEMGGTPLCCFILLVWVRHISLLCFDTSHNWKDGRPIPAFPTGCP